MVLQALLNGLVDASVILLAAVGLSLIYGVKRFANFAHGDMMTAGAYVTYIVSASTGGNLFAGVAASMVSIAFLAVLFEFTIFKRLEGRGPVAPLIASVGVALVLQNMIRVVFGASEVTFGINLPESWFSGIRDPVMAQFVWLNPVQGLIPMVFALAAVLFLVFLLQYTKLGKAMRATADNSDLARVSGINVKFVRYATWALAGAFAAGGGAMLGVRLTGITPTLGFELLILVFSAVILGGIGSAYGALLGALVISIGQNLFFPVAIVTGIPTAFSLVVPFGVMVLVLLIRPQGIAGRPLGFDLPPLRAELRKLFQSLTRVFARFWKGSHG